jgi:hypothetical protein
LRLSEHVDSGSVQQHFYDANASIYIQARNGGLANSTTGYFNLVTYSAYQSALESKSTDAAKAFVPATEPGIFETSVDVSITSTWPRRSASSTPITPAVTLHELREQPPPEYSALLPFGWLLQRHHQRECTH